MDQYVIKGRLGDDQAERDRVCVGTFYERGGRLTHISRGRRLLQAEE